MKAVFLRGCVAALALASLGACSTSPFGGGPAPVEATRFHLGGQIARAQIAVVPVDAADANTLEFSWYSQAVARELTRLGWTVVPSGSSEQIALIDVEQGSQGQIARRSPVSVGVGGSTGSYGSGVGLGLGINLGGGGSRETVATMLEVSIRRRSDQTVFWEGRAHTEARVGADEASPRVAVDRLAEGLFRDFPGESGRTIRVE
jgi:hypothetical protein